MSFFIGSSPKWYVWRSSFTQREMDGQRGEVTCSGWYSWKMVEMVLKAKFPPFCQDDFKNLNHSVLVTVSVFLHDQTCFLSRRDLQQGSFLSIYLLLLLKLTWAWTCPWKGSSVFWMLLMVKKSQSIQKCRFLRMTSLLPETSCMLLNIMNR